MPRSRPLLGLVPLALSLPAFSPNSQASSREEFDSRTSAQANSVAAVRAAEAAVETARLNIGWTQVRSPIAGRVSRAEVTEGNLVQAGPPTATLLTNVVSLDPIYL